MQFVYSLPSPPSENSQPSIDDCYAKSDPLEIQQCFIDYQNSLAGQDPNTPPKNENYQETSKSSKNSQPSIDDCYAKSDPLEIQQCFIDYQNSLANTGTQYNEKSTPHNETSKSSENLLTVEDCYAKSSPVEIQDCFIEMQNQIILKHQKDTAPGFTTNADGTINELNGGQCLKLQGDLIGGHTCHHTYDFDPPLGQGLGGCDLVKTQQGSLVDLEIVHEFSKSKGYMIKGGGGGVSCFNIERLSFQGNSVDAIVMDNGRGLDISIPIYKALVPGITIGKYCENAKCGIPLEASVVGNIKDEYVAFAKQYAQQKGYSIAHVH